jgi:hypothetical protein
MNHQGSRCEDEARAEVIRWELELDIDRRSDISMIGGLLGCIVRWRGRSHISGDKSRVDRCRQLLHSLGDF